MRLYGWQIVCAVHCITTTVKLYKSKFMHNVTQYSKRVITVFSNMRMPSENL